MYLLAFLSDTDGAALVEFSVLIGTIEGGTP